MDVARGGEGVGNEGVLAIVSVFKSDRTLGAKAFWAIGIALYPILGLVFWLIVGLRRRH